MNNLVSLRDVAVPDGTYGFHCFEDFSVGPLEDGNNPAAFERSRADFWHSLPGHVTPEGDRMPYTLWHQVLPWFDLSQMASTPAGQWPETFEFADLAPQAGRIEVWSGGSVRDRIWSWFLAATLPDLGLFPDAIRWWNIPAHKRFDADTTFWQSMTDGRADGATVLSPDEWERRAALWAAASKGELPQGLIEEDARVFDIILGRKPDPATGLTNLEARLLDATPVAWTKAARVVGETMSAGIEMGDEVGDIVLFSVLLTMARRDPPLIEVDGDGAMRTCQVRRVSSSER